uniref:Uncharacterized protein n=1 Tax=Opuntia streptacantha TaxID=393608 RepID=A0A7C8YLA4_OPUST
MNMFHSESGGRTQFLLQLPEFFGTQPKSLLQEQLINIRSKNRGRNFHQPRILTVKTTQNSSRGVTNIHLKVDLTSWKDHHFTFLDDFCKDFTLSVNKARVDPSFKYISNFCSSRMIMWHIHTPYAEISSYKGHS